MLKRIAVCAALVCGFAAATAAAATARAEEALVTFKVLSPGTALDLAQATLENCRAKGFQVAVVVVDRFGINQVMLRDRFAGPHTPETARRKAWTAISFRADTLELASVTQPGMPASGVRAFAGALMLGGGVPVLAAGSIVAGIGVSGAPGGAEDDACARAGIEAIADKIAF